MEIGEILSLKPKEGLRVIDPLTSEALPPEGRRIEVSSYWIRRLNDGDVTVEKVPAEPLAKTKKEK